MMRPSCKRCLLAEYDPAGVRETVHRYIAEIAPAQRTPDAVYRARLDACKRCEALRDGLCAVCGCYVEYRAAKASAHCPSPAAQW